MRRKSYGYVCLDCEMYFPALLCDTPDKCTCGSDNWAKAKITDVAAFIEKLRCEYNIE